MNAQTPSAIVTGGAAGIGFAIAQALANTGVRVAIVDINREFCTEAAQRLSQQTGAEVIGVAADVSDALASGAAFDEITTELGFTGILINNAGFMPPRKGWIEELPLNDFHDMMNVHLGGAVNWCRLVMPGMRTEQYGRIVNMSSINGIQPVPHRFAYVTVKKALRGLTEALALDCARAGITVNAIAPGYVLTDTLRKRAERGLLNREAIADRTPVGRWGLPEEIARMALFLVDPASSYITGTTMTVDGGLSIRSDANEDLNKSPFMG